VEITLKNLRIVRLALLASIVLYGFISFRAPMREEPKPLMLEAITGVAVAIVGSVLFFRRTMILKSEALLAAQPEDPVALGRLRAGYIVVWALCESIVLYGLVLRFIGFTFAHVLPFLIAGFVLMLFFSPRRPIETR